MSGLPPDLAPPSRNIAEYSDSTVRDWRARLPFAGQMDCANTGAKRRAFSKLTGKLTWRDEVGRRSRLTGR